MKDITKVTYLGRFKIIEGKYPNPFYRWKEIWVGGICVGRADSKEIQWVCRGHRKPVANDREMVIQVVADYRKQKAKELSHLQANLALCDAALSELLKAAQ